MNCENCGKNYANVKYTQIVNGNKREMYLCEDCSQKLGIQSFNIPIDFSGFLEDFFLGFDEDVIFPELTKELKCRRCNSSFEDFTKTGRFGCEECYTTFEEKIDSLLKNIQGTNRHKGRIGKINEKDVNNQENWVQSEKEINNENLSEIDKLKKDLKQAIKEEKYEEAAIFRDKIKKIEGEK